MKTAMRILKDLCEIGERQLEGEIKARALIADFLNKNNLRFELRLVDVQVPSYPCFSLIADDKTIECLPVCFSGGNIPVDDLNLVSSISGQKTTEPNINTNPECEAISRANYYRQPSLAVARRDLELVQDATNVKADVEYKEQRHTAGQFLVGNKTDPTCIVFTHYDSLGPGAADNASGTAVCLHALAKDPAIQDRCLFVIDGSEELSTDDPYWGFGYRQFEKDHQDILKKARKIIVVDSIGFGDLFEYSDDNIKKMALPLADFDEASIKIDLVAGDIKTLMKIYHSDLDTPDRIHDRYLEQAYRMLLKKLA